jgi:hypothetical protein
MSAIQIKDVPDELHVRLRERARTQGQSLSSYVLGLIECDLTLPTTREWLDRVKQNEPVRGISSDEIAKLIDAGREERDEQVWTAATHH